MGKSKIMGCGNCGIVNSIVEQYLTTGETINANHFVEFVSDIQVAITRQTVAGNLSTASIVATQIRSDAVFLLWVLSSSYNVRCMVITFNPDGTASCGTTVELAGGSSMWSDAHAVTLCDDKVCVQYYNGKFYLRVCEISGGTVTAGTALNVSMAYPNLTAVNDSQVLALEYGKLSLFGITGTDITRISQTEYSMERPVIHKVSGNLFFICGEKTYFTCVMAEVRDGQLFVGTELQIGKTTSAYGMRCNSVCIEATGNTILAGYQHTNQSTIYLYTCRFNSEMVLTAIDNAYIAGTWARNGYAMMLHDNGKLAYVCTQDSIAVYSVNPKITQLGKVSSKQDIITAYNGAVLNFHYENPKLYMQGFYSEMRIRLPEKGVDGVTLSRATENSPGKVQVCPW